MTPAVGKAKPRFYLGFKFPERKNSMDQFQPPADPSTVWLTGLVDAMDEVANSAANPSAADREAMANRLELPALKVDVVVAISVAVSTSALEATPSSHVLNREVSVRSLASPRLQGLTDQRGCFERPQGAAFIDGDRNRDVVEAQRGLIGLEFLGISSGLPDVAARQDSPPLLHDLTVKNVLWSRPP